MLPAHYYDGKTSRPHAVGLSFTGGHLRVLGPGVALLVPLVRVEIGERLSSAPRVLSLPKGAFCEVRDHAAFEFALRRAGIAERAVDRLQRRWWVAMAATALFVALVVGAYVWGLPRAAAAAAERLPPEIAQAVSAQTLEILEHDLAPSELSETRQAELEQDLGSLDLPDGTQVPHRLLFRSGAAFGPNALALPDGSIVLLDELVRLADNDAQVLAVLGHELGHVRHRHGLRLMIQSSVVMAFAVWWLGDVSYLLAAAPAVLASARYSRDFEREADAYAAALMQANGQSPALLAEMLEKLHVWQEKHRGEAAASGHEWLDYASSHPPSRERNETLRRM